MTAILSVLQLRPREYHILIEHVMPRLSFREPHSHRDDRADCQSKTPDT